MKRKLLLPICAVAILLSIWAGCFHYTIRQTIVIHATIDKVAPLFTDVKKWSGWHPDVAKQMITPAITKQNGGQEIRLPNLTYLVTENNPASITIYEIRAGDTTRATLSASSYGDGTYTYVEYTTEESGFAWLKHVFLKNQTQNILPPLQLLAEDDSRRYGFLIRTIPVSDTLILTTGTTTIKDSVLQVTSALHMKLKGYCEQNSLTAKDYYYTSQAFADNNKVRISVGMPVSKEDHKAQPGFEFLKLPATGRLVMGEFKGRYKDKPQLYAAMDEYVQDKRMKKVAQPLEQYQFANAPSNDTMMIFLRVYYPVF